MFHYWNTQHSLVKCSTLFCVLVSKYIPFTGEKLRPFVLFWKQKKVITTGERLRPLCFDIKIHRTHWWKTPSSLFCYQNTRHSHVKNCPLCFDIKVHITHRRKAPSSFVLISKYTTLTGENSVLFVLISKYTPLTGPKRRQAVSPHLVEERCQFTRLCCSHEIHQVNLLQSNSDVTIVVNLHSLLTSLCPLYKSIAAVVTLWLLTFYSLCRSHDVPHVKPLAVRQWRHDCCQFTNLCRSHGVHQVNLSGRVTSWLPSAYSLCRRCDVHQVNMIQSDSDVMIVVSLQASVAAMMSLR